MILLIIEQSLLYLPLVLGAYISISLMKLPDLSVESAYTFGAILASRYLLFRADTNIFCAIIASLAGGLIVGLVSSLLTQKAKIPHLLSSILTVGLFHGINQLVLGTSIQSLSDLPVIKANQELVILVTVGFFTIGLMSLFLKTQLGLCLPTYGDNPRFFEHYRISESFVFFVGILVANALAGISGYLVAQTSGFTDTTMGTGISLFCITALVLGKTLVKSKGPICLTVPIVGVTGYFSIQQLLLKCGFNLKYFTMIQAGIVLLILITSLRNKNRRPTDTLGV
jgi:putative ABC transport system permease protein